MSDQSREHSEPKLRTEEGFPYGSQADQPLSFALKALCCVFPVVGLITAYIMNSRDRKRGTREAVLAMALGMAGWYLFGLVMSKFGSLE